MSLRKKLSSVLSQARMHYRHMLLSLPQKAACLKT